MSNSTNNPDQGENYLEIQTIESIVDLELQHNYLTVGHRVILGMLHKHVLEILEEGNVKPIKCQAYNSSLDFTLSEIQSTLNNLHVVKPKLNNIKHLFVEPTFDFIMQGLIEIIELRDKLREAFDGTDGRIVPIVENDDSPFDEDALIDISKLLTNQYWKLGHGTILNKMFKGMSNEIDRIRETKGIDPRQMSRSDLSIDYYCDPNIHTTEELDKTVNKLFDLIVDTKLNPDRFTLVRLLLNNVLHLVDQDPELLEKSKRLSGETEAMKNMRERMSAGSDDTKDTDEDANLTELEREHRWYREHQELKDKLDNLKRFINGTGLQMRLNGTDKLGVDEIDKTNDYLPLTEESLSKMYDNTTIKDLLKSKGVYVESLSIHIGDRYYGKP